MKALSLLPIVFMLLIVPNFAFAANVIADNYLGSSLVNFYENLLRATRAVIRDNFNVVSRSATSLLGSIATVWIVGFSIYCWKMGGRFFTDFIFKLFLFIILSFLLSFNIFDKYVLSNVQGLFDGLPSLFGGGNFASGNVIHNIIKQNAQLIDKIAISSEAGNWANFIFNKIGALIAIACLMSLTIIVVINVLLATVTFYLVLSLSPIWILCFFLSFTRKYGLGAITVVVSCIVNMTLLGAFLNLYSGIMYQSLSFTGQGDFISIYGSIIIVAIAGGLLLKQVNVIAQAITGQALDAGGGGWKMNPFRGKGNKEGGSKTGGNKG